MPYVDILITLSYLPEAKKDTGLVKSKLVYYPLKKGENH